VYPSKLGVSERLSRPYPYDFQIWNSHKSANPHSRTFVLDKSPPDNHRLSPRVKKLAEPLLYHYRKKLCKPIVIHRDTSRVQVRLKNRSGDGGSS